MQTSICLCLALICCVLVALRQDDGALTRVETEYAYLDIYVEIRGEEGQTAESVSPKSEKKQIHEFSVFGAYQIDVASESSRVKILSVEGGEIDAFREAPAYDQRAMEGNHIIIAAMAEGHVEDKGKVRIARIHLREEAGKGIPPYTVRLVAAADSEGKKIHLPISFQRIVGE